jgi:hypothetical protein
MAKSNKLRPLRLAKGRHKYLTVLKEKMLLPRTFVTFDAVNIMCLKLSAIFPKKQQLRNVKLHFFGIFKFYPKMSFVDFLESFLTK